MSRRASVACLAALAFAAPSARALEILTDEERAEREREAKLKAKPVLACSPAVLSAKATRGDTAELALTVKNEGGQVLRWSLSKLPHWLAAEATNGELKYKEERRVVLHARTGLVAPGEVKGSFEVEAPGADKSPATIEILLVVEPGAEPEKPPRRGDEEEIPDDSGAGAGASRSGLGVRLGFMLPGGGSDSDYSSNPIFGVHYRIGNERSRLSYEFGLDLGGSEADAADSTSRLTTGRADVLYALPQGESDMRMYLLSGLGGLFETAEQDGETGSYKVALLDLGAGIELVGGSLDVRLSHARLLGSENVSGMTQFSVAYSF